MAKVLLVDDDKLTVKLYKGKFEDGGLEIDTAPDGEVALAKLKESKPDLVLLDVMMPKMDGLEMMEHMKSNPATKKIPVMLLTNVGDSEEDVVKGLHLGAVSYLIKSSYTPKEVLQKVKEVLKGYSKGEKNVPEVQVRVKKEPFMSVKSKKKKA